MTDSITDSTSNSISNSIIDAKTEKYITEINYFASGIVVGGLMTMGMIFNVGPTNFVKNGFEKFFTIFGLCIVFYIAYKEIVSDDINFLVLSIVIVVIFMTIMKIMNN